MEINLTDVRSAGQSDEGEILEKREGKLWRLTASGWKLYTVGYLICGVSEIRGMKTAVKNWKETRRANKSVCVCVCVCVCISPPSDNTGG